jgi:hypothetical protein
MNGSQEQQIACPARRWARTTGRQLTLVGSLVTCLLVASAAPVAASARPVPGGFGDLVGRDPWSGWSPSGWSVKPPIAQGVSGTRFDSQPPEILASVASVAGPYTAGLEVRVDFTCTDAGSGIRWCPFQAVLDTTLLGYHSASFFAIDVVGNVATTVIAYTVVVGSGTPMIVFPAPGGEWV